MLYCASDMQQIQRLCLATSPDLFQREKHPGNPVISPSAYWAEWPGFTVHEPDGHQTFGGCRDAHILKLNDGTHAAYWVSRLREDKFGPGMVGVAASVSQDLIHWQEVGPLYARKEFHRPLILEVESPCLVRKDGKYWLFFKHGWWTWYASSDTPFGFWEKEAKQLGYAHAAEIFEWNKQWWITHCQSDPKDFMRSDPDEFMQPETIIGRGNNEKRDTKNWPSNRRGRGFFLGKLDWAEGAEPRLI